LASVRIDAPHSSQHQCQRHLGYWLGIDAFATCPQSVVVNEIHETFDAGERQLNPFDVVGILQNFFKSFGRAWRTPYETLCISERNNFAAAGNDRIGHP
jgi:hypothetical protein